MEGTMYLNNRPGKDNGRTASVIKYDDRAKTVILQYTDDEKKIGPISLSTLKRWWKKAQVCETVTSPDVVEPLIDLDNPVTDQEAEERGMLSGDEAVEQAVVSPDTTYCSDGTAYSEVMQEIIEDGKKAKKATKKKAAKSVPEPWVDEALQFIFNFVKDNQDEVFTPANGIKMRSLKTGGHMYAKIDFSGKSVTVAVKSIAVKNDTPTKRINHMFDYGYVFKSELSATDKELIHELLTDARNYRIAKNNNTKEEK